MATTLGHALCGIACLMGTKALKPDCGIPHDFRALVVFSVLANLPDIDLLVSYMLVSDPQVYHSGPTHGILFAVGASLAFSFLLYRNLGIRKTWPIFFITVFSHVLIDALTGPELGAHPSLGAPLLSPISDDRYLSSPFTVFLGPRHDSLERLLSLHNVKVMLLELCIFVPIIGALWLRIRFAKR